MDHPDVWPRLDDPLYLETSDNLWPLLGESSISKPIIEDDNINDVLDPSVFLEQEHSALVESRNIVEGLQENVLNFHKDDNLSTINIDPSSNPWPFPQEINVDDDTNFGLDSSIFLDQELLVLAESSTDKVIVGKGVNSKSTRERNNGFKRKQPRKKVVETNGEEGSVVKKQDHNAKERVRRKNLNASYLALGSMLPLDSRRSKKRWSAPVIIDRVLDYVPELENEIKKLTLEKNYMLSALEKQQKLNQTPHKKVQAPTVSMHEVKESHVIIQICLQKDREDVLSNLIRNLEAEGMCIESASTFHICDDNVSYHLHIEMEETGAECIAILREKVTSWLC